MKEYSPYEGTYDYLNGKNCLGRVISVDSATRRCRVKTLGEVGVNDDLDLSDVQWLQNANHPEGDEESFLPRAGSFAVVTFVKSEPYIIGFFDPLATTSTREPLRPGDKITKTVAGNKIILRSGGSIEIESTKTCRSYWIPSNNMISEVCQEWEIETDGGHLFWNRDKQTANTKLELQAWDNLTPSNSVILEMGTAASGQLLELSTGPVADDLTISKKLVNLKVATDGTTELNWGEGTAVIIVDPGGNITETTKGAVRRSSDTSQTYKAPTTAIGDGSIELLARLSDLIDALGELQVLTRVGLTDPFSTGPLWPKIKSIQNDIKKITGKF